ncbi:MAG: MFS transporter [Alphaproteobacteria bacterium]|nr:MFS transporter [Alphaproteobacteria bacterium]
MTVLAMKARISMLAACWALNSTGNAILISISSLVGFQLAEDKALATLPIALQWIGNMCATVPASLLMQRIGRRPGFMVGCLIGASGALLGAVAVQHHHFLMFCLSTFLIGAYLGFNNYFRFAAAEIASDDYKSRAISFVLSGGIVAGLAGPLLARWSKDLLAPITFLGSMLTIVGLIAVMFCILLVLKLPPPPPRKGAKPGRPLLEIATQPTYLVAVMGAMAAYGVMILLMSVTPLAMTGHGFDFSEASHVIEWHILAMFTPAFFTGGLIRRFGALPIMLLGVVLNIAGIGTAFAGIGFWNFLFALAFVGLGWNFLFIGSTTLLTDTYRLEERGKAQGLNEFLTFATAGVASYFSGNLLHRSGWQFLNEIGAVAIGVVGLCIIWMMIDRRRRRARSAFGARAAE